MKPDTHSIMRTSYTSRLSGAISSVRFAAHIATITVPYPSRGSLFATWPGGTRRSIRMKILQKRLRSGSRLDRMARKVGDLEPTRRRGHTDITVDEMESTVGEFYRLSLPEEIPVQELALDADLADIFNISPKRRKGVRAAQEMLHQHRKPLVDKVAYWSGVQRPIVKELVEAMCKRV